MFLFGWARRLLGRSAVEFVNVGGWLTHGDVAIDSCAQFLAVAQHRLIPARVKSVGHQLHKCWISICLDTCLTGSSTGGHAGVGVVSLCGSPLAAPTFVTPEFKGVLQAGSGFEFYPSYWSRRVVHLFVVYGYQGSEEDAENHALTDKLLQAVLAEAKVVCVGSS